MSKLDQIIKQVHDETVKGIQYKLDTYAHEVMDEFYDSYTPLYYERTKNLYQAYRSRYDTKRDVGQWNSHISLTFSPAYMKPYERNQHFVDGEGDDFGHFEFETVNPAIIFDLDFIQGYHGSKTWFNNRHWLNRNEFDSANSDIGAWKGQYRWNAAKMTPSPYERMVERFETSVAPGGEIDKLASIENSKKRLLDAISEDISAIFK